DAGHIPAAQESVRHRVHGVMAAFTKRHLDHVVGVDLMRGIKRRYSAFRLRMPRIDDVVLWPAECSRKEIVTFSVRSYVDRFAVGVVEIELEPMGHRMAKHELAGMVVAVADRRPGIQ